MLQKAFVLLRNNEIFFVFGFCQIKILHLKGNSVDIFSQSKRSEVMSRIRSKGNKTTEVPLQKAMRIAGVKGWRRHLPVQIGSRSVRPDFVFPRQRIAVFVDGCFWHGCPEHGTRPKSNREFWDQKLESNIARDIRVGKALKSSGWIVLRFWEHSVKRDSAKCAGKIARELMKKSLHPCVRA
ncbi:very short patch repair endonuclease [bacterium]|nr:very short patch repair endonuclease [bacterium]